MNQWLAATMRRSVFIWISLVILLIWGGGLSAYRMQREYLPPISNPTLIVSAQAQDMQADQVKASVLEPIEQALRSVNGLETLETTSFDGGMMASLYFPMSYDMTRAENDVSQALDGVSMPAGVNKPSVTRISTNSFPIMRLTLTSPNGKVDEAALRTTVQAQIAGELKSVPGVGDVRVTGGGTDGYALTVRMADMERNGLTLDDLKRSLEGNSSTWIQGKIADSRASVPLRVDGWNPGLEEFKQFPIVGSDGHSVPLSTVAELSRATTDLQTISRTDGSPSVVFDVLKTPSSDITKVSDRIRSRIREMPSLQTGDLRLSVLFDQGRQVQSALNGLLKEGLLGCLMSVVCLLLFFRNIRSTALVALSLPICLTATTGLLHAMGVSLNLLTVSGLIVAMGRVIDDTIVILDNMYRRTQESGRSPTPSLIAEAVKEMLPAIASSTATTVAVYVPIAVVGGMIGAAFSGFAWSVVIALLTSLLVAVCVAPALYHVWHKGRTNGRAVSVEPVSRRLILLAMANKRRILAAFGLLLAVSVIGTFFLPVNFLPAASSGQINVKAEFPQGTSLAQVDATVGRMEQTLRSNADVATFSSVLGSSFTPQFDDVFDAGGGWIQSGNVANIAVSVSKKADAGTVVDRLRKQLAAVSGTAVLTVTDQNIAGDDSQVKIYLSGSDADTLDQAASLVRSKLQLVENISVEGAADDEEGAPKFRITLNRTALAQAGIKPEEIYGRIREVMTEGTKIEMAVNSVTTVPVTIRTDGKPDSGTSASATSDPRTAMLTRLGEETFTGKNGHAFRLDELASLSPDSAPSVYMERDGRPISVVTANITSRNVEQVAGQVKERIGQLVLPAGVRYSMHGITEQVNQMTYEMVIALTVAVLLVLCILSAVFRGWRAPLVVLGCIPLALIGSVLGMLATGGEWNLASLVGLLMLSGISVTNGIVLADQIERQLASGTKPTEAIVRGTAYRVRPVLLTAGTTVLTLLPLCFSGKEGTVVSQSLGIVVVCGLISSTFASLAVIPILYHGLLSLRGRASSVPAKARNQPVLEREAVY